MKRFSPVLSTAVLLALCLITVAVSFVAGPAAASSYQQHNLVSDLPGVADNLDPNLVNPWGMSSSPTSPFWVSDNGTGVATLYNGSGQPQALVVTIPSPSGGTSAPTGQVFNASSDFNGAHFIFATEDGTISAWTSGTAAVLPVNNSGVAVYKGLAMGNNGSVNLLYAANFRAGTIDVFGPTFAPASLPPGSFTDPNLPAGFAPFNIQNLGGKLYVTYAKQDAAKHDDVPGPGNGFVDVYDLNGVLQTRLISRGVLNSPWGLALSPANFGTFANALLVGNFGDGRINAFDPVTGNFLGTLEDTNNSPIIIQGLWGLKFGNAGIGFDPDKLYFTAGIPGNDNIEDHGLFGSIEVVRSRGLYISIVGPDNIANPFYFSPKQLQFMFNENADPVSIPATFGTFPPVNQYTRVGGAGQEQFRSQTLNNQAEVCDTLGTGVAPNFADRGLRNAVTRAGNTGFYEWFIRVPTKPSGEINLVLQCGVLKPNSFAAYDFGSIELCAAETGERVGYGTCVRQEVDPGVSPVINTALPKVTAIAYPGPFNVAFAPFHLTAFKNPSAYTLAFDATTAAMSNNGNSQVLDGSSNTRILLKACMDKTIVTKLPVTGQINALGETETDLEAGDMIQVRVDIPRQNTVDVYCHQQSTRLAGVGESPF